MVRFHKLSKYYKKSKNSYIKKRIRKFSRMKGVKIMAKIKYITRTQTTTRIKVFWFNSETDTVANYETVIPGKHTPESALKYVKDYNKNNADATSENFVPVKCEIISEEKALYRVAENEFYTIAEKVPSKQ